MRRRHMAPARRSILVGGAGPKKSAAARRGRPKGYFSKIPEKISFYPQKFLMAFFVCWGLITLLIPGVIKQGHKLLQRLTFVDVWTLKASWCGMKIRPAW